MSKYTNNLFALIVSLHSFHFHLLEFAKFVENPTHFENSLVTVFKWLQFLFLK